MKISMVARDTWKTQFRYWPFFENQKIKMFQIAIVRIKIVFQFRPFKSAKFFDNS